MPASNRPKQKTEDRQAALVQAALQMAAVRSPAEITTTDLAEVIGITQGGVFKHFPSKEAIWLAVLDWAHQALLERLREQARLCAGPGSALQALRAMFMAHVAFVQEYPGVPRLVFQELQHARPSALKEKVQALMADYRQLLAGLLAQARQDAQVSPQADLSAAAVLFIGAMQGLVMQSMITGSLKDMSRQARRVFDLFEAGLRAPATPAQGGRP